MNNADKSRTGTGRLAAALAAMALLAAALAAALLWRNRTACTAHNAGVAGGPVHEAAGEPHHGWTPFYHAGQGMWRLLDDEQFVLRERKFVSSRAERDAYARVRLQKGDLMRTLHGQGRWKFVETFREETRLGCGWIDADQIRGVEQVEDGFDLAEMLGAEAAGTLFRRAAPAALPGAGGNPARLGDVAAMLALMGVPVTIDAGVPEDVLQKTMEGEWTGRCPAEIVDDVARHYGLTWTIAKGSVALRMP